MNRTLHRIGGIFAALLLLWIAGTGVLMQVIDLKAILTHEPPTDPTELSMAEGKYGPGNFAVIQVSDFSAPALPDSFDINQGIATVLQAVHAQQNQGAGQGAGSAGSQYNPMAWIELRMAKGIPIGQVMMGTKLVAFDAQTGESVAPVPPVDLPQGRGLPPSLRQKLKTLHRFWNRSDTPGVYVEFLAGLILWTLILSGLVMYFRLLRTRIKQGRPQPFWLKGGGLWRGLHRVVSVVAAVFLLWMAFTGTWIGFESSVPALRRPAQRRPAGGQQGQPGAGAAGQQGRLAGGPGAGSPGGRRRNPLDFILPLRDAEVRDMTATTLASMQQLHPTLPIKAIRLRTYGQTKQGVVITGGDITNQYVFNADTGQPASLSEQGYPEGGFPFGTQIHENIKHLHSGDYFGIPARLMNLFAGFCLTFLSVSGIVVYFDMWLKRRKGGRKSLVWL